MIKFEEILSGTLGDHEATLAKEWLDAGAKITPPVTDTDWVNVDSRPGHLDCRIFLEDLQVLGVPLDQPTILQAKLNTEAATIPTSKKRRTRNQISSPADHDNAPPHQQLHWRALGITDYSCTHKVDISPEGLLCIGANDTSAIKKAINELPHLVAALVEKAQHGSDDDDDNVNAVNVAGPSTSEAAAAATAVATTTTTNDTTTIYNKKPKKPTTHAMEDLRSTALTCLPKDSVPGLLFHTVVGTGRVPGYVGRAQLEQTWPEAVQQKGNTISSGSNNNIKRTIAMKVTTHHMTGRPLTWDVELVKKRRKKGKEDSGAEVEEEEEEDVDGGEKYYLTGQIVGLLKKLKAQPGDVMSVIKTPDYSAMFDQEDTKEEEEGGGGQGGGGGETKKVIAEGVGAGNEDKKDKEPVVDDDDDDDGAGAGAGAGKQSSGDIEMVDAQPPAPAPAEAPEAAVDKEKQAPAEPPYIYLVELNAPEVLNAIASLAEEDATSALPGPSAAAATPPPPPPPPQRPSPYDAAMRKLGADTMRWVRERARGAPPPPLDTVGDNNACMARVIAQRRRAALYLKQRKEAMNAVNPPKKVRSPVAIRGGKKSPGSVGGKSPGGGNGRLSAKGLDLGEKKISKKKKDGTKR